MKAKGGHFPEMGTKGRILMNKGPGEDMYGKATENSLFPSL